MRITRGLGEPALFAITLSAVVSGLLLTLGVVSGDALGLAPLVYLVAGLFFVATMATYVEGSSLHPSAGAPRASRATRSTSSELHRRLGHPARLPHSPGRRRRGDLDYLAVF